MALRDAWDELAGFLERVDANTGATISGELELKHVLGDGVHGFATLHHARPNPQSVLHRVAYTAVERHWREYADTTQADEVRLTECGGPEAAWVVAVPGRPEHRLSNTTWRDSFCLRLAVPLPFLANGPLGCDCHDAFDRVSREIAAGVRGCSTTTHPPPTGRLPWGA